MNPVAEFRQLAQQQQTRRVFLGRAGRSLGSVTEITNSGAIDPETQVTVNWGE